MPDQHDLPPEAVEEAVRNTGPRHGQVWLDKTTFVAMGVLSVCGDDEVIVSGVLYREYEGKEPPMFALSLAEFRDRAFLIADEPEATLYEAAPAIRAAAVEEAKEKWEEDTSRVQGALEDALDREQDRVEEWEGEAGRQQARAEKAERERDAAVAEEREKWEAEVKADDADRWFVSVREDGRIDRSWPASCEDGETPQERLMGAGVRIAAVVAEHRLREAVAEERERLEKALYAHENIGSVEEVCEAVQEVFADKTSLDSDREGERAMTERSHGRITITLTQEEAQRAMAWLATYPVPVAMKPTLAKLRRLLDGQTYDEYPDPEKVL